MNEPEITAKFYHGDFVLECRKTDIDTWIFRTWEQRGDKQINKQAIIVYGDQARQMFQNKFLFGK